MRSLAVVLAFGLLWHLLAVNQVIDPAFYPSPLNVLKNLGLLMSDPVFRDNINASFFRLGFATLLTFPIAVFMAILTAKNKIFDQLLNPFIALTFPLPKVAIFPLLLLVFGIEEKSKIALISIGMFYPVFINSRLGLKKLLGSSSADIINIYPLKKFEYLYHYLLKGSQLEILTGMKLAINYGLTLVVVSETTTANNGVGYFIWRSWDQFKLINVYAGVYFLSIAGFILYSTFDYIIEKQRRKFF